MHDINHQIVLARRPNGIPVEEDFRLEENVLPVPEKGELLLENLYISLTPGDRLYMNNAIDLNSVVRAHTLAQVVDPNNCQIFKKGELVLAKGGWQRYSAERENSIKPIPLVWDPITINLWILESQGFAAYFGLLDIGQPNPGNTVLISGATGAIGSIAGQIARLYGCKVIGICQNTSQKKKWLIDELGFDAVVDESDLENSLIDSCQNGIDIFFDNVGGEILDAVLRFIGKKGADQARIISCGMISQYNRTKDEKAYGIRNLHTLINRRATVKGFIVGDYSKRYSESLSYLTKWLKNGEIKYKEDITIGIVNTPRAFINSMNRQSFGKALVQV